jgi:hypothetical protein
MFQNKHEWTPAEIQTVENMLAANKTHREIGAALGGLSKRAITGIIERRDLNSQKPKSDR